MAYVYPPAFRIDVLCCCMKNNANPPLDTVWFFQPQLFTKRYLKSWKWDWLLHFPKYALRILQMYIGHASLTCLSLYFCTTPGVNTNKQEGMFLMQGNESNLIMSEVIMALKQVNSFINIYKWAEDRDAYFWQKKEGCWWKFLIKQTRCVKCSLFFHLNRGTYLNFEWKYRK